MPLVRRAMIALSRGETRQLLRSIIPLGGGPRVRRHAGRAGRGAVFGAKLISVFPDNFAKGRQSHQGVVVLFDGESGEAVCVVHAGEVTAIRTAAASAVATDALARPDATRLAILGYGEQAATHARAIAKVRPLSSIAVWGRSPDRAAAFAGAHARRARPAGARPILRPRPPSPRRTSSARSPTRAEPILLGALGRARNPPQPGRLQLRRAGGGGRRPGGALALHRRLSRGRAGAGRGVPAGQGRGPDRRRPRGRRDRPGAGRRRCPAASRRSRSPSTSPSATWCRTWPRRRRCMTVATKGPDAELQDESTSDDQAGHRIFTSPKGRGRGPRCAASWEGEGLSSQQSRRSARSEAP